MRGLMPVLTIAALALAVTLSSARTQAGPVTQAAGAPETGASTGLFDTIEVNTSAERNGLSVKVLTVEFSRTLSNRLIVHVQLTNRSEQDLFVALRNFAVQDRAHVRTFPAQAGSEAHAVRARVLVPGETMNGALYFEAPWNDGLDLAVGLLSGTPPSYIRLIP